jgi:hypothetical protein
LANDLNLGPVDDGDKADDGDDVDDDGFDASVLSPTDAEDAKTRDISAPNGAVKGSRTNYQ